jgi:hypothetical protein
LERIDDFLECIDTSDPMLTSERNEGVSLLPPNVPVFLEPLLLPEEEPDFLEPFLLPEEEPDFLEPDF